MMICRKYFEYVTDFFVNFQGSLIVINDFFGKIVFNKYGLKAHFCCGDDQ